MAELREAWSGPAVVVYMPGWQLYPPSTPVSALVSVGRGEAASEGG